jgi:hypothetical protein
MATLDVVTVASVRDYMQVTDTTGQWSAGIIGSNIQLASKRLQRMTNRQWEPSSETKVFSTEGRAFLPIPDVRSVTSVILNDATLTTDSYDLLPSQADAAIFIGIQFPTLIRGWHPGLNTFDINYNHLRWTGYRYETLPNNLSIASTAWGHAEASWPIEVIGAIRAFAAFLTLRPDALLSGAKESLSSGAVFDMSRLPLEVQEFVSSWANLEMAVTAG